MPLANRRIGLQTKLLGLSAVLLTISVLIALIGISSTNAAHDRGDDLYEQTAKPLNALTGIRGRTGDTQAQLGAYVTARVVGGDADDRSAMLRTIRENDARVGVLLGQMQSAVRTDGDRRAVDGARAALASYAEARRGVLSAADAVDPAAGGAAAASLTRTSQAVAEGPYATARKSLADLGDQLERTGVASSEAGASETAGASRTMLAVLAIGIVLGLGIAFLVARSIRRIVGEILERTRMLAAVCLTGLDEGLGKMRDGDLTHEIVPQTPLIETWPNDELGDIAQSVNEIRQKAVAAIGSYNGSRDSLTAMIGQVSQSAGVLSASSQQMASTSEEAGRAVGEIAHAVSDVAQGAERQARTAESTRAVADEMSEATTHGAEAVQQTASAAEAARSAALEGADAAERTATAMHEMSEVTGGVVLAMRELGEKSERIGGIVDTITGIAGQTNLLALNAAIEAARAGEQGRGFAVVAEQVRKLAEESQAAAASIAGLVGEIQSSTEQATAAMNNGTESIEVCRDAAKVTEEAFGRITGSVSDVHGRVEQIAVVMDQISASSERVRSDVAEVAAVAEQSSASSEQVSASTQETSASTQQVAASAQELARTAEELEELCGRFVLVGAR